MLVLEQKQAPRMCGRGEGSREVIRCLLLSALRKIQLV